MSQDYLPLRNTLAPQKKLVHEIVQQDYKFH